MKNRKSNFGFSYIYIIYHYMANFEAFCWNFPSSISLFFLKSDVLYYRHVLNLFFLLSDTGHLSVGTLQLHGLYFAKRKKPGFSRNRKFSTQTFRLCRKTTWANRRPTTKSFRQYGLNNKSASLSQAAWVGFQSLQKNTVFCRRIGT